ncbi:olfactory receptor 13C9-like [Discoglossus pictus]
MDTHLHTPMYMFLCNLSFADICLTTVTLTKLMDILLSGNNSVSAIQCFTQMFFFLLLSDTEIVLLSVMAYDRYIAICNPLQYHLIMNKKKCILLMVGIWLSGFGNSTPLTALISILPFCHSNEIPNFYCDFKALTEISCAGTTFYIMLYIETCIGGLFPFLLCLISYYKIITSILHIRSMDSRRKVFSTCTSHLTVLTMFYGTLLFIYAKPPSEHTDTLDHVFSVGYTALTPLLNPLVYSLRNKEIKNAMIQLLRIINTYFKIRFENLTKKSLVIKNN